jgi:predicted 3-demethylubiquinone-9 3-methyltransferase (glyoxalase superfamily)
MSEPMKVSTPKITPCLWFDTQAEAAAQFYVCIFKNTKIRAISHYAKTGHEIDGRQPGSVMTVAFEIDGQVFVALNGGPHFKFNEAISLQINCETQEEIAHFLNKLTANGQEGPCGWVKNGYGVSWQVVPTVLPEMLMDPHAEKSNGSPRLSCK